jgi:starch phosphorylase
MATGARPAKEDSTKLLRHYGCGSLQFTGEDGFYERHLLFDTVKDLSAVSSRHRYEAVARSVRDVLSQRWIATDQTYERINPKRVYYISMEFLLGRSLANNITNLLIDPLVKEAGRENNVDLISLLEQEPDAGLGNGGLGRLAACFLEGSCRVAIAITLISRNSAARLDTCRAG